MEAAASLQDETFCFLFSSDILRVNRKLLCQHSRVVRKHLEQRPATSFLNLYRGYYNAFQSIIDYVDGGTIPEAPGCVDPDALEARRYMDVMLLLCCFAETYEMDDLANRSIDALRLHEYQCQGSLLGRHIEEIYEHTATGSKLRHYCTLRTACFIWNAGDSGKLSASLNDLLHRIPEFDGDVHAAQATVQERARIQIPDCDSPDNQFGVCEFHTHRKGDICHVALAVFAEGLTLHISNPINPITEDDLMDLFKGYEVTSAYLSSTPRNPRRHAHVSLSSRREVERAIIELSGKEIHGSEISVKRAYKPCPMWNVAARIPRKASEEPTSFNLERTDNDGANNKMPFDLQELNNQDNLSRPPAPPPGYGWYLRHQWALVPIDHLPECTAQPSGTYVQFDDGEGAQYQHHIGSESLSEQNEFVTSHARNGHTADSATVPLRATALSLIKNEDPVSGTDLYSAEDYPPITYQSQGQVKAEDQEPPSLLPLATMTRRQRKHQSKQRRSLRFPFKCNCKNQFSTDWELEKHVHKYQGHRALATSSVPSQTQNTKANRKNVKNGRVKQQLIDLAI